MGRRGRKKKVKDVLAELTAKRSTCMRRSVGAVIVKDRRAIATGYNGAPRGIAHCEERGGCIRQQMNIPSRGWILMV